MKSTDSTNGKGNGANGHHPPPVGGVPKRRTMTGAERQKLSRCNKKRDAEGLPRFEHVDDIPGQLANTPSPPAVAVERQVPTVTPPRDVTPVTPIPSRNARDVTRDVTSVTVERDAGRVTEVRAVTGVTPDRDATSVAQGGSVTSVTPVTSRPRPWYLSIFSRPSRRHVTAVTPSRPAPVTYNVSRHGPGVTPRRDGDVRDVSPVTSRPRRWGVYITAALRPSVLVAFMVAVLLATADLRQNALYVWRLGATTEDQLTFAALALAACVLTIWGIVIMRLLARFKSFVPLLAFLPVYALALYMNASHNIGFNSTNIGDAIAARQHAKSQYADLTAELKEKLEERRKAEARRQKDVSEVTVEQSKKALALRCPTDERGNLPAQKGGNGKCLKLIDSYTTLLGDFDASTEVSRLDARIAEIRSKLGGSKAIGAVDPELDGMVRLNAMAGIETTEKRADDYRTLRLALMGLLSGLVFLVCKAIWEGFVAEATGGRS